LEIEIFLNGDKKAIVQGLTVAQLVNSLGLIPQQLAIEYNQKILKKDHWPIQVISNGDRIEIVHFVGGGHP
jgi:thiamine biosynthesis protein ThiS